MDISLHYRAYGQGRPLVLLHGNGGDSGYFSQLIPAFARHHRVIAVDTRGHGHSPRGQAPFSIRQFAQDLKAFLDQHGLTQVDLLGFSDGGNIALTFALQYPASLRRLVLNGANLNPAGLEPWFRLPVALGYRGAALLAGKSAWAREKEELFGLMVHEPTIRPRDLAELSVPTLVIAGTRDIVKPEHTRTIARSLPNARLVLLPGDHSIARKTPKAFYQAVEDFLLAEGETTPSSVDRGKGKVV